MEYTKRCDLPSCNKIFKTNRKWQRFCKKNHHDEYWRLYRSSENQIRKELASLKKEQEKIKEKLGIE